MNDELWLKELAQAKRDQDAESGNRLDERWDRLSAGTLSPEEEAELRALAETSEEAGEAYEAFRPLGADFQARVVREIRERGLVPIAERDEEDPSESAKPLPFWRRIFPTPQWAGWSAAAAAAAAVVAVLMLIPPSPVPLPIYAFLQIHGDQVVRGEDSTAAEVTVLAPGSRFQGTLQLATASKAEDLEAQYFLIRGQDLRRLEVKSDIDPGGAIKMKGSVGPDLSPGAWILWAVVGRRGKLPEPSELKLLPPGAQVRREDWVAVPKEIKIQNRDLPP